MNTRQRGASSGDKPRHSIASTDSSSDPGKGHRSSSKDCKDFDAKGIEKLTPSAGYKVWSESVRCLLRFRNLEHVTEKENAEATVSSRDNFIALNILLQVTGGPYKQDILVFDSARDIWNYLREHILGNLWQREIQATKELLNIKDHSVDQLVCRYRSAAQTMLELNKEYSSKQLLGIFMSQLPSMAEKNIPYLVQETPFASNLSSTIPPCTPLQSLEQFFSRVRILMPRREYFL